MAKLNNFLRQLHLVPRAFSLIWSTAKVWTAAWAVILVVQSALPVLNVLLTRTFVNSVIGAVETDWNIEQVEKVLLPFVLLSLVMLVSRILDSVAAWVRMGQSELVRDHISRIVQVQATRLDMTYYEQNEYYDLIHRVREQARNRPLMLLESTGLLVKSLLSLVGLAAILATYGAGLLPLLVISAIPAFWGLLRFNQRLNRWRIHSTTRERQAFYYDRLLTERLSAPEIKLFNLGEHYRKVYWDLRTELRQERLRIWRSKVVIDLVATFIGMGVAGGVMLWMGWRVLEGTATLGDLAALFQIFTNVQESMSSITSRAGDVYESILFLEDLFTFLDLQPYLVERTSTHLAPLKHEIRFENVTFRYPGSDRNAINNYSMILPAGKITALVGVNGEGKTTLMKLLCRFYDPIEGRILWDGVDIRDVPISELQRQISMLFQNPYYYPETAHNNIAVGDIDLNATREELEKAAISASAHEIIMKLPQGYETVLGKWFGGEDLSIGQWQRLALARALFRRASVVILDEPTSAMDAWAETDWLSHIRDGMEDRTLIMITHRFTTAMHADQVIVIHNQQVVEQGTHAELIQRNGRYAQSWYEQMRQADEAEDLPILDSDSSPDL